MKPQVAVGFTASGGVLGKLIRAFEGDGGASHTFLAWYDENLECWVTLGANSNGLTIQTLEHFVGDNPTLWLCKTDLWPGIIALRSFINSSYDYAGLLGMSVVEAARLLAIRLHHNPFNDPNDFFCSEYVTKVMRLSGLDILPGVDPGAVDPAHVLQAVLSSDQFTAMPWPTGVSRAK